eukprot:2271271-Pleurochrysis_carterae.AAC.1
MNEVRNGESQFEDLGRKSMRCSSSKARFGNREKLGQKEGQSSSRPRWQLAGLRENAEVAEARQRWHRKKGAGWSRKRKGG